MATTAGPITGMSGGTTMGISVATIMAGARTGDHTTGAVAGMAGAAAGVDPVLAGEKKAEPKLRRAVYSAACHLGGAGRASGYISSNTPQDVGFLVAC